MQEDYSTDRLVCIYWHIGDSWEFAGATARKNLYGISAYPTTEFDAVQEVVGAGSTVITTFRPIVLNRMSVASPVTITSHGYVGAGSGSITAKFKADAAVSYTNLLAQFVVIEETGSTYPWTAREVVTEPITLSAPGDSVVVTKNFTVGWTPIGDLQV